MDASGMVPIAIDETHLDEILEQLGSACGEKPQRCATIKEKIDELDRLNRFFSKLHGVYGIELEFKVPSTSRTCKTELVVHPTPCFLERMSAILKRAGDGV